MLDQSSIDCSDVAHFRMLLKQDRSFDDNIKHKLNSINANHYTECAAIAEALVAMHNARRRSIIKCIDHLSSLRLDDGIHQKELNLIKGEDMVEDIVEEQSWSLLHDRCRVLGDLEKYKRRVGDGVRK